MKRIRLLLFTLLICFLSTSIVSATTKLTCTYYGTANIRINTNYILEFILNGDTQDVKVIKEQTYIQEVPTRTESIDVTETYKNNIFSLVESDTCPKSINITLNSIEKGGSHGLVQESTGKNGETVDSVESEFIGSSQCYNFKSKKTCRTSGSTGKVACVWVDNESAPNGGFCNVDNLLYVRCGGASDIPMQVPSLISMAVNLLKIATPIILIFVSLITLLKAMSAGKEDEMKKAQSSLIKKIIAAALVFFVVSIVQFIVSIVANDEEDYTAFSNCLDCFLNNTCEPNMYYKTVVGGFDMCTSLTTGVTELCNSNDSNNSAGSDSSVNDYKTSCNGEYFTNGYQPKAIKSGGVCFELINSNKKIKITMTDGSSKTQTLWKAGQSCYYWNGEKKTYVRVSCNATKVNN